MASAFPVSLQPRAVLQAASWQSVSECSLDSDHRSRKVFLAAH